jgi:acyl-CoA thioesterase FadM
MRLGRVLPKRHDKAVSLLVELYIEAAKGAEKTEFLYYFQRRSVNSAGLGQPIKRASFDFDSALKEKTVVLIEINQSALGKASFGFAEHFLQHISRAM